MSRIIGFGLTLIKEMESNNYIQNSNFIIQKFINKKEDKNIETLSSLKRESPNLKIKEKKEESNIKPKDKESESINKNVQKTKKKFNMDTSFLDND